VRCGRPTDARMSSCDVGPELGATRWPDPQRTASLKMAGVSGQTVDQARHVSGLSGWFAWWTTCST